MKKQLFILLFIISLISTYIPSNQPDNTLYKAKNYYLVKSDFHVHSFFGDGGSSPLAVVYQARKKGLDCFALTNHNQLLTAQIADWWTRIIDGPLVFVGSEITAPNYHIIGLGLKEKVDWKQSATEIIKNVQRQGGVTIAAHPTKSFSSSYDNEALKNLDGSEVLHPLYYDLPEVYPELLLFYNNSKKVNEKITPIASSDWHVFNGLGYFKTIVLAESFAYDSILAAIKAGRTVVRSPDGIYYGKKNLIELVKPKEQALFQVEKPNLLIQFLNVCFLIGLVFIFCIDCR